MNSQSVRGTKILTLSRSPSLTLSFFLEQHIVFWLHRGRQVLLAERLPQIDFNIAGDRVQRKIIRLSAKGIFDFVADRIEAEEGIRDEQRDQRSEQLDIFDNAKRQ